MRRLLLALALGCSLAPAILAQDASPDPYANETKEERAARMAWWHEARFGMFIHWGVYAVPAGTYDGKQIGGIGEWIMCQGKIPMAEYQKYAEQFNPVKYDADAWVQVAKKAGMKYIVITSKHHDGFTLFPSAATNWGIGRTPYGKDLLKPLADACRKHGLRLGFYYSQAQDWNNGGSACSGKWDPAMNRSMDEYIDQVAVPQVKEILTQYGPGIPAVLWWDTPCDMNKERADKLIPLLKLQPGIIHNNRLGHYKGDTETPEQHIPATGYKDRDWETCMTMNDTWGFKSYDHNWKPVEVLLRNLIDIASKGGNYLLNVGPTAEGEIPPESIERLLAVGEWMKANGEAIYGTTASPFRQLPWGRCTKKVTDRGATLYLHVFDWPKDGRLPLPGLKSPLTSASLLVGGKKLKTEAADGLQAILVPEQAPDPIASVIVAQVEGPLEVEYIVPPVLQAADGSLKLTAEAAEIVVPEGGESPQVEQKGGEPNIGFWLNPAAWLQWTLKIDKPGTFDVSAAMAGPADGVRVTVGVGDQKVEAAAPETGAYETFETVPLGRLTIGSAGVCKLSLRPVADGWQPINVRNVILRPATH
jgi:alpha-L-fucosidase